MRDSITSPSAAVASLVGFSLIWLSAKSAQCLLGRIMALEAGQTAMMQQLARVGAELQVICAASLILS